jgi:uncharacterized protein (UPF0147 family)
MSRIRGLDTTATADRTEVLSDSTKMLVTKVKSYSVDVSMVQNEDIDCEAVGSLSLLKEMSLQNNMSVYTIASLTEVTEQQVNGKIDDSVFEVPE